MCVCVCMCMCMCMRVCDLRSGMLNVMFLILRTVPPRPWFEMTPSVSAERGGRWCLAPGWFSHSQINQEQTEAPRLGWGRHRLTPPLCCEIILGPPVSITAVRTRFLLMTRRPDRMSLIDVTEDLCVLCVCGEEN